MADNAGREGRGWTIAGAFAGQAIIFVSVAAALVGVRGGGPGPASASAVPVPAISAVPVPAPSYITLLPVITAPDSAQDGLPIMVSVDGQSHFGLSQRGLPTHWSYTVPPGQDLTITLRVEVPATLSITDLSVSLGDGSQARGMTLYDDAAQPLTPGEHTFMGLWAGSASELQPGTTWSIYMSTNVPIPGRGAPIATISVRS
jgi:hypothetical protein